MPRHYHDMGCSAIAVTLLLLLTAVTTNSQDTCLNKTHSIYYEVTKACYFVGGLESSMLPWAESEALCQREGLGGHLTDILDQDEQDTVTNLVARTFGTSESVPQLAWAGLMEHQEPRWTYLVPNQHLRYQGCRASSGYEYQNETLSNEALANIGFCISRCAAQDLVYTILRGGRYCYCSDNVSSMPSTGCDMPCTGSASQICGGTNAESVYMSGGARSIWTPGQPAGEKGMEDCGALSFASDGPGLQSLWRLGDEPCHEAHMGMCRLPRDSCFTSNSLVGPRYALSDHCYWLSTVERSWYQHRRVCEREGGALSLYDNSVFSSIDPLLRQITNTPLSSAINGSAKIWMGVTRRTFTWTTGESDHFVNWALQEPSQQECMALGRNPIIPTTVATTAATTAAAQPLPPLPFTTPSTVPPFTTPSTVRPGGPVIDLSITWGKWLTHSCSVRLYYICEIPICYSAGANCVRCDPDNDTKCAECEEGFYPHPDDGRCAETCITAKANCTTCETTDPSRCSDCQDDYFLDNGICKESCFLRDPHCETCDIIDLSFCGTCKDNYFIQSGTSPFCKALCTDRDPNCMRCVQDDLSMCDTCVAGSFMQEGTDGFCEDGFFGNALVDRQYEEQQTNLLMLFELPAELTMPREINSWNYYAKYTGYRIYLMLWRQNADISGQFMLIASQLHTAMEVGSQFVPTTQPITMEPGDLMGLHWPGKCPIPFDDGNDSGSRVARQAECPSGKVYATTPQGGFVVGQSYSLADLSPTVCRVFSFQFAFTPLPTTGAPTTGITHKATTGNVITNAAPSVATSDGTTAAMESSGTTSGGGNVQTSAAPPPPTTIPNTTPTTATTPTTPTATTGGESGGGSPNAGASTNNNSSSSISVFEIIMIILIAVLIILVIIAIIMLIKHRKKNSAENVQVKPEVVDMRDQAHTPDTDSLIY